MVLKYLSSGTITEDMDQSDIFDSYMDYIDEHKSYVQKAYEWLRENCIEIFDKIDEKEFQEQIIDHDNSKFSDEEFEPYAQKWFGDGIKTPAYENAWEHHWKNNPHHPEYWDGKDMPEIYILEMLCDWLSFGLKQDNPAELIDFYENKAKNDPEKNLSDNTKDQIDKYLMLIKEALDNINSN